MAVILETKFTLPLAYRGKVRDTYDLGDKLLIIATDRISAYDCVLPCGIPDKGLVLNQLSAFWFEKTRHIIPNHLIEVVDSVGLIKKYFPDGVTIPEYLSGRSMIVRKADRIPVEAVVRGYLSGSAWEEYKKSGTISGIKQVVGLKESQVLPQPLFTPTTKADVGHDMPLSKRDLSDLVGNDIGRELEEKSLALYQYAQNQAKEKGLIIADTKFEFGFIGGKISLIDEILTPDSSRFWDMTKYVIGQSQPSYDKQPVRDWLTASGWNKQPPAPMLPQKVIDQTSERYRVAYQKLAGKDIHR
jgi:phosphoribosylaminoimidazole-succinocarboxamide synthase